MNENYYRILGLDNFASADEVRQAYRRLAKKYHPDINPDKPHYEDIFKRISTAYRTLTDPQKKLKFDRELRNVNRPKSVGSTRYSKQRTSYATKTKGYTPIAWMYARIFIIIFIMAIVLIPLTLLYQSSVRYYESGLKSYAEGQVSEALLNFNNAMSQFGGRSLKAGIKATEIYLYELSQYEQARFMANRTLDFAERMEDFSYLYFLRGCAYHGESKPMLALRDYQIADSLNYNQDSIQLKLGFLNAFALNNFFEGEKNFNYLIGRDVKPETAWFGKAWCQQELNQNQNAISSYSRVIDMDDSSALAYYYRGLTYLKLTDSAKACEDIRQSQYLGYARAQQHYQFLCAQDSLIEYSY